MIERKFIKHNVTENKIKEYIMSALGRAGIGDIKLQLTPLGEKIVVFSSNPGLVVGKEGSNIKELTYSLKRNFGLENPQVELSEVPDANTRAQIVADRIAGSLERYGTNNFKGVMHRTIGDVMRSGVRGIEVVISGKIPGARAKCWRVLSGYMKKCGDVAVVGVQFARATAKLKSGIVGVKVRIMPFGLTLPDTVIIREEEAKQDMPGEGKEVEKKEEPAKEEEKKAEKKKAQRTPRARKSKSSEKKKENDKASEDAQGTGQSGTEEQAQ